MQGALSIRITGGVAANMGGVVIDKGGRSNSTLRRKTGGTDRQKRIRHTTLQ